MRQRECEAPVVPAKRFVARLRLLYLASKAPRPRESCQVNGAVSCEGDGSHAASAARHSMTSG